MPEDEFTANLASMDRSQLQALLNEMETRGRGQWVFGAPDAEEPRQWASTLAKDISTQGWGNLDTTERIRHTAGLRSGYGAYRQLQRSKKAKKQKAEYDAAMAAEQARQKQILAERMKTVQNQLRTVDMRDKVNQQFRDLDLEGLFDRVTKNGLDNQLLGITQQHEDVTRGTGFQAVSQGLGGSSVDAERIADVQSSQEQAMAQAAAQAQMQRTQLGQQSDQTRRNLLASVSGSNPGEEARLTGEIQNIQNNANAYSQNAGITGFGMQQNQQQMAGQSQALGGLLSNYANLYTTQNGR